MSGKRRDFCRTNLSGRKRPRPFRQRPAKDATFAGLKSAALDLHEQTTCLMQRRGFETRTYSFSSYQRNYYFGLVARKVVKIIDELHRGNRSIRSRLAQAPLMPGEGPGRSSRRRR